MGRFDLKLFLGFLFTVVVLSLLSAYTYVNNRAQQQANNMVTHTTEVMLTTQTLMNGLLDAETGQRGYIISGKEEYLKPYLSATAKINESLDKLRQLTVDNVVQQRAIDRLQPLVDKRLQIMETVLQSRAEGFDRSRHNLLSMGGVGVMENIRKIIDGIHAVENNLLKQRMIENDRKSTLFDYTYAATGGAMLAVLSVTFYLIYRHTKIRERSAADLRLASLEIKDLYDKAPCGYFSIDSGTTFINVNQTLADWLGYRPDELIKLVKFEDILTDKSKAVFRSEFENDIKKFKASGVMQTREFEFRKKDHSTIPVEVSSITIFDVDGGLLKTRSTVFDIADRKRVESERDNFFNYSPDLLAVFSMDGEFLRWNEAWNKDLGYSDDDLLSRDIRDLLHPDDLESTMDVLHKKLNGGERVISFENRYQAKDRSYHWLQWNAVPLPERGVIYGFARDITDRKLADEKIKLLNHELEAFTYSVSHDLRAPLRSIMGYAHILKEDHFEKLDEQGIKTVEVIASSAKKMGKLIDDLLDFSRMGRMEISRSVLNMHEMVEDILKEKTSNENSTRLNIRIHDLKPTKADVNMVRHVWTNLISNALKYSTKKETTDIEIGSYDKGDENWYYVADKGAGFDMKYYEKLFGVFQRLHKAHEFEGTGVGLALVKRIVERHGGRVGAEGKLNEGSRFYFSLPKG